MAKATRNRAVPLPLPPDTITVELTLKEAEDLAALTGQLTYGTLFDLHRLLRDLMPESYSRFPDLYEMPLCVDGSIREKKR